MGDSKIELRRGRALPGVLVRLQIDAKETAKTQATQPHRTHPGISAVAQERACAKTPVRGLNESAGLTEPANTIMVGSSRQGK